jgi:hypothetical protein
MFMKYFDLPILNSPLIIAQFLFANLQIHSFKGIELESFVLVNPNLNYLLFHNREL